MPQEVKEKAAHSGGPAMCAMSPGPSHMALAPYSFYPIGSQFFMGTRSHSMSQQGFSA